MCFVSHDVAVRRPTLFPVFTHMTNWGEKDLLLATLTVSERCPQRSKWRVLGLITLFVVPIALHCASPFLPGRGFRRLNGVKICPQADALYPDRHAQLWESLGNDFSQDAFTLRAVEWRNTCSVSCCPPFGVSLLVLPCRKKDGIVRQDGPSRGG
jgi:hypothetical protein